MPKTELHQVGGRALKWAIALLVALALVLVASPAWTTIVKYADMAALVDLSETIVRGNVVGQHTFHGDDGQLHTHTTVAVEKTYFGPETKQILIQQWGGELDGLKGRIPGDARFERGEDVVVFLHAKRQVNDETVWFLAGLGMAKFRVRSVGKSVQITRDLSDLAFYIEHAGADSEIKSFDSESYTYAGFEAELEALIAGIKGGRQ